MNNPQSVKVRRALVSVSDKSHVVEFATRLHALGIEILSTGGTARLLLDQGIPVVEVSEHTGFPEIMGGRVKTLHPRVHGGILGRRGTDDPAMAEHGIEPIDLVVVNLYPFEATVAREGCELEEAIENIDIGGPAMVRAAAKNYRHVGVVVDPADYDRVADELTKSAGSLESGTRFALAAKAFNHTAGYDGAIANYLGRWQSEDEQFPGSLHLRFQRVQGMRYGENPHQGAAFYSDPLPPEASLARAEQLQGKALSFNNIGDADAALECVKQFQDPSCVIVKHANPCGVAVAADIGAAYERAFETDPTSAFGGIIAFNREVPESVARAIVDRQFLEVLIAPGFSPEAMGVLGEKKNVRVLRTGSWTGPEPGMDFKRVFGGLLAQERDLGMIGAQDLRVVTQRTPTEGERRDLLFAWRVAKFVKSNAIVYARDQRTIGVGAGQMSRVYSAKIAGIKAADEGLEVRGSVMASDAFFPFRDGIDAAAEAGISAVIEPGGSVRDEEVIAAADEYGMAMVFTGMRHFRH